MDDFTTTSAQDSWEYDTGRTQPPKNRGSLVALLLILVIFLTGITTVLGVLNIRLFRKLSAVEQPADLSISFQPPQRQEYATVQETAPAALPDFSVDLHPAAPGQTAPEGAVSLQQIYQQNIPSVASVTVTHPGGTRSGCAVILSTDGYLVTAATLVENAAAITVTLTDAQVLPAQLVGADTASGLAVIRVESTGLVPGVFGDSTLVQTGDSVVSIGDPMGMELRGTMTDGIVCAVLSDVYVGNWQTDLIQTNAASGTGYAGSPLINAAGQIVGILCPKVCEYTSEGTGLSLAVPSATVKTVVEQLIRQGYVSGCPTLGLTGETLSTFYQHYYKLPAGLFVTQVDDDGPAAQAGLAEGDILISVGDAPVFSMQDLKSLLFSHKIGDELTVTVYRAGSHYTFRLVIGESPRN